MKYLLHTWKQADPLITAANHILIQTCDKNSIKKTPAGEPLRISQPFFEFLLSQVNHAFIIQFFD
jgi:hypothetical protein